MIKQTNLINKKSKRNLRTPKKFIEKLNNSNLTTRKSTKEEEYKKKQHRKFMKKI